MRNPFVARLSFILCFFWIYLCVHNSVASTSPCLEDQRSLLLQLKKDLKLKDEDSSKLASWNQHVDCCEWEGVSCDNKGHIAGLDLSYQNISGEISNSSSLFNLQHLQYLNLAYNSLDIEIPSGFHKLINLIYLNLSCAGYMEHIPLEISHLTRLVSLDISVFVCFAFTDQELKLGNPNLEKLVQNLTDLSKLYLDGVNISAEGEEWCSALLSLPSLQELSMSDCNLVGPIDSLAKLEHLSVIRLDMNDLSSLVPKTLANLENLTTLSLALCNLRGTFPPKIFQLGTLSFVDISYNEDLHGSLLDFPWNASLKTLIVSKTSLSGPIPNSIGNLRQLTELDLSNCQLNETLPMSMSSLSQLVHLDLSHNRFTGPIPSFNKCKKLIRELLSSNYFNSSLSSTHFEGLLNLVDIDLRNNSITGRIPSSMFMLPSVRNILLSHNQFDGQLDGFVNFSRIQSLDLSNNHLEGPIPPSLFQLRELRVLQLPFNKFSGEIEINMIQKLGNLTALDLSYNNLSIIDAKITFPSFPSIASLSLASCNLITFPKLLQNQSELLSLLDLSNNHLSGSIPHWLSSFSSLVHLNISYNYLTNWEDPRLNNMSNLFVLDLHFNYLQGSLPSLPLDIIYLDYSSNNMGSLIPPNIDNYLFGTIFLSFSSNNLHGNIPESFCNASNLEVLDLSNNYLIGMIPKCLIAMNGTLSILNLGRNKLTSTIGTFPGLCDLRTLDLHGNFLQGKIPKYLVSCVKLEVLDLRNNQINDQFPCWLKGISTLRVLVLRSNKLHGSLKCSGTQEAWPYVQIVDLAYNNFSGKIPPIFFETLKAMTGDENDEKLPRLDYLQFEILKFGQIYYQDRVTVTSKNLQMDLVKILTVFTSVDLSCNNFEGPIPKELGQLKALHILNMSHNAFWGHIPSSLATLNQLECLDISNNSLSGEIPTEITNLSFLSFLNLSYNHLVGKIPTGTQIQTFEASSFIGNEGLCGPPLTQNFRNHGMQGMSQPESKSHFGRKNSIDWNFLRIELGFAFGIGIVLWPLVFWKRWRIWYWEHVDELLYQIFPQLDFVYECCGGKKYRTLR